jgi:segregation and condensation protein A
MEAEQENTFPRAPGMLEFASETRTPRPDLSIFDLVNAVNVVLKRFNQREDLRDIFEDKWSVSEKIEHLMRSTSEQPRLKFSELFAAMTSRSEVVVTFLALLELIRLKQLAVVQSEPFGEIEICRVPATAPAPAPVPTAGAESASPIATEVVASQAPAPAALPAERERGGSSNVENH